MSVVTATISSNHTVMPSEYELLSIDVVNEVNRIPYAQITLLDGDAAKQKFAISDGAFFQPGKEIDIKLRYEGKGGDIRIFTGLVVRHAVEASEQGLLLTIEMKDAAIKLTRARKSAVYRQKTDTEIIGSLITSNGLTKGPLADTAIVHPEIIQYYCTDWDFILSRADAYGMLVMAENGKVSLAKIKLDGAVNQTFTFGVSEIFNFEIEADANHQYASVESLAWDVETQNLTQVSKAADFQLKQGNLDSALVANAVGGTLQTLTDAVSLDPKVLQAWADGTMIRSRMAMIRGRISIPGLGSARCLNLIKLAGIGSRFNGTTLVTGVRHRVDINGWQTDIQFGLSAEAFAAKTDVMDRPAAGQLPGVNGLQIGIVTSNDDPDKKSRIRVMIPGIDAKKGEVWARLASPDAGKGRGYFFRPEPGDEVIVGFFNDDPRQAVILGAMFSTKNAPPDELAKSSKDNLAKGIITRSGITLGFLDDKKPMVFIETPGSNKIIFDDDGGIVQISDQHGNSITMNKDGIEIKSAPDKDVKINASGNVEIKGAKVDVK